MKIRDLLVILFTASVALLLFLRSARADGSCPEEHAGESCGDDGTSCHESTSSTGADRDVPFGFTEWTCADICASACDDAADAGCLLGCYPVCVESCYLESSGAQLDEPELELEPVQCQ